MEVRAPSFLVREHLKLLLAVQDLADVTPDPAVVARECGEGLRKRDVVREDLGAEARELGGRGHASTTTRGSAE
jgi:hypothetical protein